jgi:RNA polymerase-interacting CarD/CdnL/TRCF family regulator
MTGRRFLENEDANRAGQIAMRARIAKWMRETADRCRADSDTRAFAKLYERMADEIETLEPR